jgi:polar amino acid transport system permease protein
MNAPALSATPQQLRLRASRLRMGLSLLGALAFLWLLGELLMPWPAPIGPAARQFVEGARVTASLTLVSGALGLLIGLGLGLGKMAESPALHFPCEFIIWVIRGTPLLTQLLFLYLALPALLPGLQWSEFWTAVAALAINVGAYNAEVFRAGVQSVPRGQWLAARALGMRPSQTFRFVVLPQAMRLSLPALANNLVALLKDSSLAYAIGVVEINMIAQRVQADSFQPVPVFITTAVIYLILTTALTQFSTALEERMAAAPH